MLLLLVFSPLIAILMATIRSLIIALPLMIGLHFLHNFVPLVPQLGFFGSFWLSFVVFLLFGDSEVKTK